MLLQSSEVDENIILDPARVGLRIKLGSKIPYVIALEAARVDMLLEDIFIMHDEGEDDYLMHDDDEDDFVLT